MGAHPGHRQYGISLDAGKSYAMTGTDDTLTAPVTAHWTGIGEGSFPVISHDTPPCYVHAAYT